jgi:CubicO group peptidase (beta-lactamase class C family)
VDLLSAATVDRIFEAQSDGPDLVLGLPYRFGLGYGLANENDSLGITSGKVCFWGGWGGSIIINDLDNRVTLAYMMNRMQAGLVGNDTSAALITALGEILG